MGGRGSGSESERPPCLLCIVEGQTRLLRQHSLLHSTGERMGNQGLTRFKFVFLSTDKTDDDRRHLRVPRQFRDGWGVRAATVGCPPPPSLRARPAKQ